MKGIKNFNFYETLVVSSSLMDTEFNYLLNF